LRPYCPHLKRKFAFPAATVPPPRLPPFDSTSAFNTQGEAVNRAREIARRQKGELLVHDRDGEIRSRDSYGHDPYPPKG
jgi:Uncharacterized protein conserved in bacteria (DUF2188)